MGVLMRADYRKLLEENERLRNLLLRVVNVQVTAEPLMDEIRQALLQHSASQVSTTNDADSSLIVGATEADDGVS